MFSSSNNVKFVNYYSYLGLDNIDIAKITNEKIFELIIKKKSEIEAFVTDLQDKLKQLVEVNTCESVFRYSRSEYDRTLLAYLESLIPKPTAEELRKKAEEKAEELKKKQEEGLNHILNTDPKFSENNLLAWFNAACKTSVENIKPAASYYGRVIYLYQPFVAYCNNPKIENLVRIKLRNLILENKVRMKNLLLAFNIPRVEFQEVFRAIVSVFYDSSTRPQYEDECKRQFLELILSDNALSDLFIESILVENEMGAYYRKNIRSDSCPKRYTKGIFDFTLLISKTIDLFNLKITPQLLGEALNTLFNSKKFLEGVIDYSQYIQKPFPYEKIVETHQLEVESHFLGGVFEDSDDDTEYKTTNVEVIYMARYLPPLFKILTSRITNCPVDIIGERILETADLFKKVALDELFWKNFSPKIQKQRNRATKRYRVEQADNIVKTYAEKIKNAISEEKTSSLFFHPVNDKISAALYLNLLEYLKSSPMQHGIIICAILSNEKLKALKLDMEKCFKLEDMINYIYKKLEKIHGKDTKNILYDRKQIFTQIIEPINTIINNPPLDGCGEKELFLEIFKNELDKMHQLRGEELREVSREKLKAQN